MSNCPTCSDSFDSERAMKIHHSHVHNESLALEDDTCDKCGDSFKYYSSAKPGKYCPDCVKSGEYQNFLGLKQNWGKSGKENPNYSGGEFQPCDYCGEDVWVSPWQQQNQSMTFCCKECSNNWMSENNQAEGNPNWRGGYNPRYSDGWYAARREALERDNYECQICGSTEDDKERNCDVHHKEPVREFTDPSDALRSVAVAILRLKTATERFK